MKILFEKGFIFAAREARRREIFGFQHEKQYFLGFWTMVSRFSPNLKTCSSKEFIFGIGDVDPWKLFLKTIPKKEFIFGIFKNPDK